MTLRDPSDIEADLREAFLGVAALGREYMEALHEEGRSEEESTRAMLTLSAQLQTDIIVGL